MSQRDSLDGAGRDGGGDAAGDLAVLCLEPDPDVRDDVAAAVRDRGLTVTASGPDEVSAALADARPDCVLAGATSPASTLPEVVAAVGDDAPSVPVVARVPPRPAGLAGDALDAGVDDVCRWGGERGDGTLLAHRLRSAVARRRETAAMARQRRQFRRAQSIAGVGNWEWDLANDRLVWSEEVFNLFGVDSDSFEASYAAFLEFVHPDDRAELEAAVDAALEADRPYDFEHRIVTADGELRFVRERGEVEFRDGEPVRMTGVVSDITDRVRRDEELERYRDIVQNLPVGVWRSTDGDRASFVSVNDELVSLLGAPDETAVRSREPSEFYVDSDDRETFVSTLREDGVIEQHEVKLQRLDGEEFWASVTAIARETRTGEVQFDGMVLDVTDRKAEERRRRASEEKFRGIVETSHDSFYQFDRDGEYIYASPAIERMTGYDPDSLIGKPFSTLVHPDDHPAALDAFRTVIEGEVVEGLELRLERADGDHVQVEVNAVPIREDGAVVGVQGIARDITQRKRRERALAQSRKKFRTLLDAVPDAIVIADAETRRVTEVNRTAGTLFDRDTSSLVGSPIATLHPEGEADRYREAFRQSIEQASSVFDQFDDGSWLYARSADGSHTPVEINATVVELDGERRVLGVFRDISDRVAREQELRASRERLESTVAELERSNEELEQFAYVASHDLQEPLRMVSSYLDLLAAEYEDELGPEADEYIAYAVDGADRMRRLIDDLLKYSRVQTHGAEFESTDPAVAFEAALDNLTVAVTESDATVTRDRFPRVEADQDQLVQLFQNLLSNAIEYSGDGPPVVHVSAERVDGDVRFSVRDEGVGVAPDQQERIFEIFTRGARNDDDGTGVGLAICQRIVRRHGGTLSVESTPGEGATFTFDLPEGGDDR